MIPPKPLAALASAWGVGVLTGTNYIAHLVDPKRVMGEAPSWVAQAEIVNYVSMMLVVVGVVSWMLLDIWEQRGDADGN